MVDYTETNVRNRYPAITGITRRISDELWQVLYPVSDQKVQSDGFSSDELKIIACCYYIAYLASGARIDADGKYTSASKSIGTVSESISLGHGSEKENAWLDRYNALITNEAGSTIGGRSVYLPPPVGYGRDNVTARRVRAWWRFGHGRY